MKPEDSHCKALVMFQRPKGLQGIQHFFLRGGETLYSGGTG